MSQKIKGYCIWNVWLKDAVWAWLGYHGLHKARQRIPNDDKMVDATGYKDVENRFGIT